MDVKWFEMNDIIKRDFNKNSWVVLCADKIIKHGKFGFDGFDEEYFGLVSIMVPLPRKEEAYKISWTDFISRNNMKPIITSETYYESGKFINGDFIGTHLVLEQFIECTYENRWYLSQDLLLALGLIQEKDSWLCPEEDFIEVARIKRDEKEKPVLLEIRTEYLKDYLAATNSGLFISTFQSRRYFSKQIIKEWSSDNSKKNTSNWTWEKSHQLIHEGNNPFSSDIYVTKLSRTDVDIEEDVPEISKIPNGDSFKSESYNLINKSPELNYYNAEIWKSEWVDPSNVSNRVRGDKITSSYRFIVDASGNTSISSELIDETRWLWFKSNIVNDLLSMKLPILNWYSENTGEIGGAPNKAVHFGMNELGLINVFASDIAYLPEFVKKIWVSNNVTPDGKLSKELYKSQIEVNPASTIAPEILLIKIVNDLDDAFKEYLGVNLYQYHSFQENLNLKIHRFLVQKQEDIFKLSKEITKFAIERMNYDNLNSLLSKEHYKLGTIKKVENVLNSLGLNGREMTSVLVGVYNLRQGEAHLSSSDYSESFILAGLNLDQPFPLIGKQLINNVAKCLINIYKNILKK